MKNRAPLMCILLLLSGMSALAYQIVWTRELRLVFGHSTAASAAVLAIFIGGLGFGSLLLGPRADRHPNPLAFYARLEGLIAIAAAVSPVLLGLVSWVYIGLGGSERLGPVLGNLVRLPLAALVLGVPTLLMGGTLPAAARTIQGGDDQRRRTTALLYGLNTLGASAGAFLTTFVALEALGNRRTLLLAAALNLIVAALAALAARGLSGEATTPDPPVPDSPGGEDEAPRPFVLAAAAVVGFAFFLMEMVWYRMLGPLLGGTVFTFGLILAVALVGMAIGGLTYSALGAGRRFSLVALAVTCLLEAAAVALPFAFGDRLAILALLLRPMGQIGFHGHVLAWTTVTSVVVLPAAVVAGVQFPLLIALLGRGRDRVGRDIGRATACNTGGAILGALVGGFGLIPALTAPGCWRLVAVLLGVVGISSALLARVSARRCLLPAGLLGLVALLLLAEGPTAAFRHSGIGAGRTALGGDSDPVAVEDWLREKRRDLFYETDGIESSFAILGSSGLAFSLNGKIDGHARHDAPTQVMSGLVGAIIHPQPRRILVIGLGTGSTAGWLADVPGVERVDVIELEPAVVEMARHCAPVNRNALDNPRLHLHFADARETLLSSRERYDLIFSEPSNPYRAGIASLFSQEFYQAVSGRLAEGGLFLQWIQAYEIDAASLRSLYRTLGSEFPAVETWQTDISDLLLVASREPLVHDLERLGDRVGQEPFSSALRLAWRTASVEGLLARFVGTPALANHLAAPPAAINSDDRNTLEFGFARTLGMVGLLEVATVREASRAISADLPRISGALDLLKVEVERLSIGSGAGEAPDPPGLPTDALRTRSDAHFLWTQGQRRSALTAWRREARSPESLHELTIVAELLAEVADPEAERLIEELREVSPIEADVCLARLRLRQGLPEEALPALERALEGYRVDPWPSPTLMEGALLLTIELVDQRLDLASDALRLISQPFALQMLEDIRQEEVFLISSVLEPGPGCAAIFTLAEPHVPFDAEWLEYRDRCYRAIDHPRAAQAAEDLARFRSLTPVSLLEGKDSVISRQ